MSNTPENQDGHKMSPD